ncbi:hypothetical protein [Sphingobacterium bovisgrunnientis]|uniref:hypothetical protein n=1 Tax=Sphingobacterium bovisgrunnientis TaxID=1874697 RepID=UPI00135673F2|nr:hypothetical protein [Sphingobacterium bovisgrunnientis]
MKNLIGTILILITIFSCSKSDIDFNPEDPILGKWELISPANDDTFIGEIKERSFNFGKDSVGIRGIEFSGRWGGAIAAWDRNATIQSEYTLSEDEETLSINYEDVKLFHFDILKLNKRSLKIKSKNSTYISTLEFKRVK